MMFEQRVKIDYNYAYCAFNGLEIEDVNDNKILITMTDDQFIDLAERLDAKREYILEKRKEKLEDADADSN